MQIAWGLMTINKQISQIVTTGELPSLHDEKRNKIIILAMWTVGFSDWLIYTCFLKHYTDVKDYEKVWFFDYIQTILFIIFMASVTAILAITII